MSSLYPHFEGMLQKKGHSLIGGWNDRWCVLHDNILRYYERPNTKELGALKVEDCNMTLSEKYLTLTANDHEKGKDRTYVFMSEDTGYVSEWHRVLTASKNYTAEQEKLRQETELQKEVEARRLAQESKEAAAAAKIQSIWRVRRAMEQFRQKKWVKENLETAVVQEHAEGRAPAQAEEVRDKEKARAFLDVATLPIAKVQAVFEEVARRNTTDEMHYLMTQAQRNPAFTMLMDWVTTHPTVWKAVEVYTRKFDFKLYRTLIIAKGDSEAAGFLKIIDSYKKDEIDGHLDQLQAALDLFSEPKSSFTAQLMAKAIIEQRKLVALQNDLEARLRLDRATLHQQSLNNTVHLVVQSGNYDVARMVKDDFGMPDERYIWCLLGALGQDHKWDQIEGVWEAHGGNQAAERGKLDAEPFVVTCLDNEEPEKACKYVAYVNQAERYDYAMRCGAYKVAAEAAATSRDREKRSRQLRRVEEECTDDDVRKFCRSKI